MFPANSQLVLSLFPGIDLLGKGFEQVGFSVVRGPDLITGGDIRHFHTIPNRFDGVIGGSPCPDFSKARRSPPTGNGLEMLFEYRRVVLEAKPKWWLLENVAGVPDLFIDGYSHQRIDINAIDCGLSQNRLRHFQFGHIDGLVISPERLARSKSIERCCTATEGTQTTRRTWLEFCALQGLPNGIHLPSFTQSAQYRAVGNGVPVPMAVIIAKSIENAFFPNQVKLCTCGCGRLLNGRAVLATAACRKRMQRRRNVTDLDLLIPG